MSKWRFRCDDAVRRQHGRDIGVEPVHSGQRITLTKRRRVSMCACGDSRPAPIVFNET